MARTKMYGGNIFEFMAAYRWLTSLIGIVLFLGVIALILYLAGVFTKKIEPANTPSLSMKLSGISDCKQNSVGCTPTGVILTVTPDDVKNADGASIFWHGIARTIEKGVVTASGDLVFDSKNPSVTFPAKFTGMLGNPVKIASAQFKAQLSKPRGNTGLKDVGEESVYQFS